MFLLGLSQLRGEIYEGTERVSTQRGLGDVTEVLDRLGEKEKAGLI